MITYNKRTKLKENKKAKKAKLETTNVLFRPSQKWKKPKTYLNIDPRWDKNFQFFGKICKIIAMECSILIFSNNSILGYIY